MKTVIIKSIKPDPKKVQKTVDKLEKFVDSISEAQIAGNSIYPELKTVDAKLSREMLVLNNELEGLRRRYFTLYGDMQHQIDTNKVRH